MNVLVAHGLGASLVLAMALLIGQPAPTPAPPCDDANARAGGGAAALRPPDVLLSISSPRAGEMMPEAMPAQEITVTVDYWGPRLVAAASAHAIDEYHLVFFLDVDDDAYVGTLLPAPRCTTAITHSAARSATFGRVVRGPHTVYVMLVGSNDVSVNPPVAASSTFVATSGS